MDIIVNYWAVLGGAIFLFIMGMVWYGPIFGKTWGRIFGMEHISKEEMARMQKKMMPYYGLQFVLTLFTSCALYHFVQLLGNGLEVAFWIWIGFAMPMAAGSMWDTKDGMKLTKFLVIAGYQLVTLLALGWAYSYFGW